jgi:hypothetical protein
MVEMALFYPDYFVIEPTFVWENGEMIEDTNDMIFGCV